MDRLLVLVVDRDDDIGTKAGIKGPIIGYKNVLRAAEKLALADPEDSDANTLFAALKIYEELKKEGRDVEVAAVTGHPSVGFAADVRIRRQLEEVFEKFPADGVVFVSDGAEDDQIIPIVLSFAPIVSKKLVIVKQAKELERTYYVIKEALKDPALARLFLGLPGIVLLLWFLLGDLGLRVFLGALGFYLLLKGFGVEDVLIGWVKNVFSGMHLRGPAAPLYLLTLLLLFLGGVFSYQTYMYTTQFREFEAVRTLIGFVSLAGLAYILARIVDAHFERKAYRIGKYLTHGAVLTVFWILADVTLNLLEEKAVLRDLMVAFLAGALLYIVILRVAQLFDISAKLSEKLVGLEVFDKSGRVVGRVGKVDRERKTILIEGRRKREVSVSEIEIKRGRVVLRA